MATTNRKYNREEKQAEKKPYEPPAVIHSGIISTRAGSPIGLTGDGVDNAVDPADLFGNGS